MLYLRFVPTLCTLRVCYRMFFLLIIFLQRSQATCLMVLGNNRMGIMRDYKLISYSDSFACLDPKCLFNLSALMVMSQNGQMASALGIGNLWGQPGFNILFKFNFEPRIITL